MDREKKIFFLIMSFALIVAIVSAKLLIVTGNNKPTEYEIVEGNFVNNDKSKKFDFLEEEKIKCSIDKLTYDENVLSISGWALILGKNSNDKIKILLRGNTKAYMFNAKLNKREDVTHHFNDNNNYDMSGFELYTSNIDIISDNYEIYIVLQDINKYSYKKTGRIISIAKP